MFPNDENIRTFATSSLSAGKFLRVKIAASVLALAGATDFDIGTLNAIVYTGDTVAPVWLRRSEGTEVFIANAAITAGADVYAAASGKVGAIGFIKIGTALTASTADGDQIEVLRHAGTVTPGVATVAAAGSTVSDAAALTAGINIVTGADGTKGVVLPTAPTAGTVVIVKGTTSATLKVWPDAAATINAIGSNSSLSLTTVCPAIFVATSTTQWYSVPLVPS